MSATGPSKPLPPPPKPDTKTAAATKPTAAAAATATATATATPPAGTAKPLAPAAAGGDATPGYAPVVCDNGSYALRVGFASTALGGPLPKAIVPTIVGVAMLRSGEVKATATAAAGAAGGSAGKEPASLAVGGGDEYVVGDACVQHRALLECTYPVLNGLVADWRAMTALYDHAFHERLGLADGAAAPHQILLTERAFTPAASSAKLLELMFERYAFGAAKLAPAAMLVLYGQGLLTGVAVDVGHGACEVTPVWEGNAIPMATKRLPVGGAHVTRQVMKLLRARGYHLNRSADFETVRQLKEALCYVANDLAAENRLALETTAQMAQYTLPDGRTVKIGAERFLAPECLFNPALCDLSMAGVHHTVFGAVNDCGPDLRKPLARHLVLAGGTSLLPGFSTRLERCVRDLYVTNVLKGDAAAARKLRVRVEDAPARKHAVYAGGAVLADLMRDRPEFWTTRAAWAEDGPRRLAAKAV